MFRKAVFSWASIVTVSLRRLTCQTTVYENNTPANTDHAIFILHNFQDIYLIIFDTWRRSWAFRRNVIYVRIIIEIWTQLSWRIFLKDNRFGDQKRKCLIDWHAISLKDGPLMITSQAIHIGCSIQRPMWKCNEVRTGWRVNHDGSFCTRGLSSSIIHFISTWFM